MVADAAPQRPSPRASSAVTSAKAPVTTAKAPARAKAEPAKAANAHVRSREEAERDALATQRVVARSLGNAPAQDAGAGPAQAR